MGEGPDDRVALLEAIDALDCGTAAHAAAIRGCGAGGANDLVCAVLGLGRAPRAVGPTARELDPPVVMIAGDTAVDLDPTTVTAIRRALHGRRGTLVGGGTGVGVAGLVASIGAAEPGVRTIGYLPGRHRSSADPRYDVLRYTDGDDFSLLDPVAAWEELLDAGLRLAAVRVLGVGGGDIAGLEYRLALALGASLGLLAGSGRAVDDLLGDERWSRHPGVHRLADDADAIRHFLTG
ncbi:MAG: hypothetical protein ABL966_02370 [Acidimicrobiales bacterium]